jgi:hypothetical protein
MKNQKQIVKEGKQMEATELRLVKLAQKIADMYQDDMEPQYYRQLCNAITVCREYYVHNKGNWEDMYNAVLNMEWTFLDEEVRWRQRHGKVGNVWGLVRDILICNCYLRCMDEGRSIPKDMKIQEENIPKFVALLESSIGETMDYQAIFAYWHKKIFQEGM